MHTAQGKNKKLITRVHTIPTQKTHVYIPKKAYGRRENAMA
jgi:hypothetical protein